MNACKATYSKLTNDTAVKAVIGTRCFAQQAPEGITTYPMVVMDEQDEERDRTYSGPSGLCKQEIQVSAKAISPDGADTLANLIKAAMDQQKGVWGSVTVLGCFLSTESDTVESGDGGEDQQYFMKEMTFTLWSRLS